MAALASELPLLSDAGRFRADNLLSSEDWGGWGLGQEGWAGLAGAGLRSRVGARGGANWAGVGLGRKGGAKRAGGGAGVGSGAKRPCGGTGAGLTGPGVGLHQ